MGVNVQYKVEGVLEIESDKHLQLSEKTPDPKKKKVWCCFFSFHEGGPGYDLSTFAKSKKESISKLTANALLSWENLQKQGWKCFLVEIIIKPVK